MLLDARKTHLIDPIHIREMLAERDSFYCQCWTLTQESQFFWRTYGYDSRAIRIEIDLANAFEMGIRIEPVVYTPFLLKDDWIKEWRERGVKFAKGDEKDLFWIDENGYYHGNASSKTAEMQYAEYVITTMYSMHDGVFNFEKIPIPKIVATKQVKFEIENEVRLFIKAYSCHNSSEDREYHSKHENYVNRVYGEYDKMTSLDTHMPKFKSFSFAANNSFIKSILCHPYMPDALFEQVHEAAKQSDMLNIFKGKSTIFDTI